MQKFINNVAGADGRPVVGASVQVNTLAGAAAVIYSDNGVTVQANPIVTGSTGGFAFYAADGRYSLVISGTGLTTTNVVDILLEDLADGILAAPGATLTGNLTLSGVSRRIVGDFSSTAASAANRVMFQTSTTNGGTFVTALPHGSGVNASFDAYNGSDTQAAAVNRMRLVANSTGFDISSGYLVSGVAQDGSSNTGFLPINLKFGGGVHSAFLKDGGAEIGMAAGVSVPAVKTIGLAGATRGLIVTGSVSADTTLGTTAGNLKLTPAGGYAATTIVGNSSAIPANELSMTLGQNKSVGAGEVNFFNNYTAATESFDWWQVTTGGSAATKLMTLKHNGVTNGTLITSASAAAGAGIRLPHGAAPTSPADGDMWTTAAGLFVRINGATKTVTLT